MLLFLSGNGGCHPCHIPGYLVVADSLTVLPSAVSPLAEGVCRAARARDSLRNACIPDTLTVISLRDGETETHTFAGSGQAFA